MDEYLEITIPLGNSDIKLFEKVVNQGIDSHLEGFGKSEFFFKGHRLVLNFHRSELHILLRRLKEIWEETRDEEAYTWMTDIMESEGIKEEL